MMNKLLIIIIPILLASVPEKSWQELSEDERGSLTSQYESFLKLTPSQQKKFLKNARYLNRMNESRRERTLKKVMKFQEYPMDVRRAKLQRLERFRMEKRQSGRKVKRVRR
jgi:hypothetical protein